MILVVRAESFKAFKSKDGYIVFGAGNDGQFAKLCNHLDRPDLPKDARFKTNADRVKHRQELVCMYN